MTRHNFLPETAVEFFPDCGKLEGRIDLLLTSQWPFAESEMLKEINIPSKFCSEGLTFLAIRLVNFYIYVSNLKSIIINNRNNPKSGLLAILIKGRAQKLNLFL